VLTRDQKKEQVAELKGKLGRAAGVYVADYRGIDVQSVNALRRRVRTEGDYEYNVSKNSVLRRAVADSETAGIAEHLSGPTAIAISYSDPIGLAKILVDFAKDHKVFELKGGMLDGEAIDVGEISTLATLPSLDELRGKLVGLIVAPATKLVRLISEPGSQIARAIAARGSQEA
jgi:large subunit ribosomal protein L10